MNSKLTTIWIGLTMAVLTASLAPVVVISVTTTNDSAAGSLRQAILDSNLSTNVTDTIAFAIGGAGPHTITPATALPIVTDPVVIDGYTQSGASSNTLVNGDDAVLKIVVLRKLIVDTSNTTVRGLSVLGIDLGVMASTAKGSNVVEGNFIGLDPAGTNALPGAAPSVIYIPNNRVGGTTPGARNIRSGSSAGGIEMVGANANGNVIQGNFIGTDKTGTKSVGNVDRAVVCGSDGTSNIVGGVVAGARNIISGNLDRGITLDGSNNVVQGNFIGVDVTGSNALGNARTGVEIGGPGNLVGGTNAGAGNIIAFNGVNGGGAFTTNGVDVKVGTVGYRIFSNSIYDNRGLGIDVLANGLVTAGYPVLNLASNAAAFTVVKGTFSPSTTFVLELFVNPTADPSGFGEGKTLLVSSNLTTDAGGNFTVNLPALLPGLFVTATGNGTSEFSQAQMVTAAGSTNSWTNSVSGKWEQGTNWSLGYPPYLGLAATLITNANSKTVTIDATTAGNFPSTLIISNLTIGAPSGATNTLALSNSGTNVPLRILRNCILTNGGALTISNASLQVLSNQIFNIDGALTILDGSLIASNASLTTRIGTAGHGSLAIAKGTAFLNYPIVGLGNGALGEFTLAGGTATVASVMDVGDNLTGTGLVWVTGGQLDVTGTIYDGLFGPAQFTVSNGSVRASLLLVASLAGSRATFTAAGGTTVFGNVLMAENANATGFVFVTGGSLVMTNATNYIARSGIASMTVTGGTVLAAPIVLGRNPGSQATLTVGGGTMLTPSLTTTGTTFGTTSTVWVTGGQLTVTNAGTTLSASTLSRLTVSNGILNVATLTVLASPTLNPLIVAGGTLNVLSELNCRDSNGVWITGGQLVATNSNAFLGTMTISNGAFVARNVFLNNIIGRALLTVAGGSVQIPKSDNGLVVGGGSITGVVWQTGGEISLPSTTLSIGGLFSSAVGVMTTSNGTLFASNVFLAAVSSGRGTYNVAGGTNSVVANLILGDGSCVGTGIVNMTGGELFVTNADGNATLDIRSGTFSISGGLLRADKIVVTNSCGHFVNLGGAVFYNTAVLPANDDTDGDGIPNSYEISHGLNALDPANAAGDSDGDGQSDLDEYLAGTDPTNGLSVFRITSIVRTNNNNIRIDWSTAGGRTNRVLVATPAPGGSFTNDFSNLSSFIIISGSGDTTTNYIDVGGATNSPSRFYRIRVVP